MRTSTFSTNLLSVLTIACIAVLFIAPVHAFTANSLDITLDKNGDAVARFQFTLEGFLENAIPQSMLEDELKKGLTTSSEPPVLLSMDKTGTTMRLKKFASTRDVEQGTEYRTASMNFEKAEIALKNSALSSVVTADFSPETITVTFPDGYTRKFTSSATLPALTHIVIDPSKPQVTAISGNTGSINVTASPEIVQVYIDGTYTGDTPGTFSDIPAGSHAFRFQKDGFQPVTKTISVVEGETASVFVFLEYDQAQAPAPSGGILPLPGFGLVMACLAIGGSVMVRRIIR
jgi:hypothetical protein